MSEIRPFIVNSDEVPAAVGTVCVRHLTPEACRQLSVGIVEINGVNDLVRNKKCTANYYVLEGLGTFSVEIDGRMQDFQVEKGDSIFIPKMTWYQDRGNMCLISSYTPAFDASQVEKK
jgi:mannose-6-phosphate isomerase-like protein (cupin superfamily)